MELEFGKLSELTQQYSLRILIAAAVLIAFWLAGYISRHVLRKISSKVDTQRQDVLRILGQALHAVLVIIGLISALGTLGVNVAAMVAGLGLTGFALSFALKDVLSNALAGVMILFYQPFNRGQQIRVSGFEGTVGTIDLRYTELVTDEGKILIPNAKLFVESVTVMGVSEEAE